LRNAASDPNLRNTSWLKKTVVATRAIPWIAPKEKNCTSRYGDYDPFRKGEMGFDGLLHLSVLFTVQYLVQRLRKSSSAACKHCKEAYNV
jgi:hypothetical protein